LEKHTGFKKLSKGNQNQHSKGEKGVSNEERDSDPKHAVEKVFEESPPQRARN
jgi:hypothetical protein